MIGDTVLIVGASSGIGAALASALVAEGARVVLLARRVELLQEQCDRLGADRVLSIVCDIAQENEVQQAYDTLCEKGWLPDTVFLNAGLGEGDGSATLDLEKHRDVFDVNYFGLLRWVALLLPDFLDRQHGCFVATSSVMATRGIGSPRPSYGASKAALSNAFESFSAHYHHSGVRFVLVHPGPVDTAMLSRKVWGTWSPEKAARYILKKLKRGCLEIHFPWVWTQVFRVLRLLPTRLFNAAHGKRKHGLRSNLDEVDRG